MNMHLTLDWCENLYGLAVHQAMFRSKVAQKTVAADERSRAFRARHGRLLFNQKHTQKTTISIISMTTIQISINTTHPDVSQKVNFQ